MKLIEYTSEELCLAGLRVPDKESCLDRMCARLEEAGRLKERSALHRALLEREKVESTGIGGGIALPHARCEDFDGHAVAIAHLAEPIDYGAPDGRPVDLVFLLAGSSRRPGQQLRVLARISTLVRIDSFLAELRAASTPEAMCRALRKAEGL